MDRVFLDANVLFSAAYSDDTGLRRLWSRRGTHLVSSAYAVEEARRNLPAGRSVTLDDLVAKIEVASHAIAQRVPREVLALPEKDRPIVIAALAAACTHLLTGDQRHFGDWFGKRIGGMLVLRPAEYLHSAPTHPRKP